MLILLNKWRDRMKEKIKKFIGYIKCKIYKISIGKKIYLGSRTKIVNGKNIKFENDIQIRPDCFISCNDNSYISLKNGCDIGTRSRIISGKKIILEEDVLTGPNVYISDQDHKYQDVNTSIKKQGIVIKDGSGIKIGKGSWIGTNSVIIGNIEIGKGCVIGANSVVTKNIPDYCVVAGSPARIIKRYNFDNKKWERVKNG